MRERGGASIITIAGIVSVLLVVAIFFFTKPTPAAAGGEFMDALVRGDTATLTELSYMQKDTPEEIRKKWDYVFENVAKHYRFQWAPVNSKLLSDDRGTVVILVEKDFGTPGSYPQKFELPMVMENGEWKVDVRSISREMFPGLPR